MRRSKFTVFLCADRKLLVLSVSTEIDFVVVVKMDLISVWGMEFDLMSV